MYIFIISLTIVVAVLLVLVVLMQNSKGGLSSQFGGAGSSSQMIGVKRTTDLLEKVTWVLAIVLLTLSLTSNLILAPDQNTGPASPNIDRAQDRNILPNVAPDLPSSDDPATDGANETPAGDLEDLIQEDTTGN